MDSQEDEIIRLLADTTNRAVLTALNDAAREMTVTELAERLVSGDTILRSSNYESELEQTVISLHHDHLPRLDEAGLIEYDTDNNVVSYGNYSSVDAEWMDLEILDELLSRFRTERRVDESAVGLLEGRDDVYEHCRELADGAENELFLIYASDDLLDEDCLPHAKSAIERDVELYAGTKSRDAREFFREYLPDATIWDPQMDWMYDQSSCPRISRLIVVDRKKVVIGLWDEDDDGTRTEIALVGQGDTNPLVVLVRELLGPRLDHLDYQSDDFLGNLPFNT
ncbi:DUF7344 domain-containing protein [Natrinema salsiterrestre]|uniref:ArsR family transcriptional regulator n=1 Tax=Natrinema salsiterrestre TaxID=2950540 RepID=A0A9Q4Q552_9EURY|nr:ArsR family transcriptional regulator [Natrinema salsiterrestre]MDF9747858.1 ArsR family transcriptional regulator [Natrinema salsiterrestre]